VITSPIPGAHQGMLIKLPGAGSNTADSDKKEKPESAQLSKEVETSDTANDVLNEQEVDTDKESSEQAPATTEQG